MRSMIGQSPLTETDVGPTTRSSLFSSWALDESDRVVSTCTSTCEPTAQTAITETMLLGAFSYQPLAAQLMKEDLIGGLSPLCLFLHTKALPSHDPDRLFKFTGNASRDPAICGHW